MDIATCFVEAVLQLQQTRQRIALILEINKNSKRAGRSMAGRRDLAPNMRVRFFPRLPNIEEETDG